MYAKFAPVQLGIENLTILAVDAIDVARSIAETQKDGLQYTDAFVLIAAFPKMAEIGKVARFAFAELKDLTSAEARALASAISEKTGLPNDGTILGKVKTALSLSAETYEVVDAARAVIHKWGNLFSGTDNLA